MTYLSSNLLFATHIFVPFAVTVELYRTGLGATYSETKKFLPALFKIS